MPSEINYNFSLYNLIPRGLKRHKSLVVDKFFKAHKINRHCLKNKEE